MTISKEKFEQISIEVFHSFCINVSPETIKDIAHALIKRVEAEQEIVTHTRMDIDKPPVYLIALPLVEE